MSAYILEKLCLGCQRCVRACPQNSIHMVGHTAHVNPEQCIECEECVEVCMQGSITFREDKQNLQRLEKELDELRSRWPAHSVKPEMVTQQEELEEEIADLRKRLESN
ncbi:MAG: 4Fe-4S dicluster domain-containing protein [Desulfitobacterium sp.]